MPATSEAEDAAGVAEDSAAPVEAVGMSLALIGVAT